MLNSKKQKLMNNVNENPEVNVLTALDMPDILSNITTGLDVHLVDLKNLIEAPIEWNFYSPLPPDKMDELVLSIAELGLMHPIVVWQQNDETFMILSGHNRKKAYEILLKETHDPKYEKIFCYIKKNVEITEDDAKEIIIDTNWVQRHLSNIERAKSVYEKYIRIKKNREIYKHSSENKGRTRDVIAQQYDITGRQVHDYYRLNYLVPELQEMVANNKLSIKAGVKLSQLNPTTQTFIFDNFKDKLNNKLVLKLDATLNEDMIREIFKDDVMIPQGDIVEKGIKFFIHQNIQDKFKSELDLLLKKYNIWSEEM